MGSDKRTIKGTVSSLSELDSKPAAKGDMWILPDSTGMVRVNNGWVNSGKMLDKDPVMGGALMEELERRKWKFDSF